MGSCSHSNYPFIVAMRGGDGVSLNLKTLTEDRIGGDRIMSKRKDAYLAFY